MGITCRPMIKKPLVFGIDCWNENKLMSHVYLWTLLVFFRWITWTIFVTFNNNFVLLESTVLCFLFSEVSARSLCQSFRAVICAEESVNGREGYCVKPLFTDAKIIVGGHIKNSFCLHLEKCEEFAAARIFDISVDRWRCIFYMCDIVAGLFQFVGYVPIRAYLKCSTFGPNFPHI
jgi:hypothetical protein